MFGNIDPFEEVSSRTEAVQTAKDVHEGGFATAARPHDRHEFASLNFNAYTAQRVHPRLAQFVILVRVFHTDDRALRRSGSGGSELVDRRRRFHGVVSNW